MKVSAPKWLYPLILVLSAITLPTVMAIPTGSGTGPDDPPSSGSDGDIPGSVGDPCEVGCKLGPTVSNDPVKPSIGEFGVNKLVRATLTK